MTTATITKGSKKALQNMAEDFSCLHLEEKGVEILERNWTCESGCAHIIAKDDDALVFIEVKARSSAAPGFPDDHVTREKRSHYERIAMEYIFTRNLPSVRVRFDVMALLLDDNNRAFLRHHKNAFCEA